MPFRPLYLTEFNFLITTFNFHLLDPSDSIYEAEYQKGPLSITFISGKGEIDIDFWVSLEFTENHPVFRPYISRDFPLNKLALRQDPGAFDTWPSLPYLTSEPPARLFLAESAKIMRKYCEPLLRGDLTMLEEITRERRKLSKK